MHVGHNTVGAVRCNVSFFIANFGLHEFSGVSNWELPATFIYKHTFSMHTLVWKCKQSHSWIFCGKNQQQAASTQSDSDRGVQSWASTLRSRLCLKSMPQPSSMMTCMRC